MSNSKFFCGDNQVADNLFSILENSTVLSEKFTKRVESILMVIITNLDGNEDWVKTQIHDLKDDMKKLIIFSDSFIHKISGELLLSVRIQEKINENKK